MKEVHIEGRPTLGFPKAGDVVTVGFARNMPARRWFELRLLDFKGAVKEIIMCEDYLQARSMGKEMLLNDGDMIEVVAVDRVCRHDYLTIVTWP